MCRSAGDETRDDDEREEANEGRRRETLERKKEKLSLTFFTISHEAKTR